MKTKTKLVLASSLAMMALGAGTASAGGSEGSIGVGAAIHRCSSRRPAAATSYTFLSGRPDCATDVERTQPSASIRASTR